jgi:hypothetical protein
MTPRKRLVKTLIVGVAAIAVAMPASAAQAPTLEANPAIVGVLSQVALSGTTGSAKAGQTVFVQAKECRASFYRVVAATTSGAGGGWATSAPAQMTTTFRARVGRAYSRPALVRKRAVLSLTKMPSGRIFLVRAFGGSTLSGRTIRIERHTASGWVLVQRAKLRRSDIFGVVETTVRIRRTGLLLRAFMPLAAAKPCFVAGASNVIRS